MELIAGVIPIATIQDPLFDTDCYYWYTMVYISRSSAVKFESMVLINQLGMNSLYESISLLDAFF